MAMINTFSFMEYHKAATESNDNSISNSYNMINNRKSYQSPVVEIISWEAPDVITTSGITHVTTVTPQMGDDNYTCTYDMDSGR